MLIDSREVEVVQVRISNGWATTNDRLFLLSIRDDIDWLLNEVEIQIKRSEQMKLLDGE